MNKFWTIFAHTYMTKVKAKSFIITSVISLVFIFGIANIQSIIDLFTDDSDKEIAIIDDSGELFAPLEDTLKHTNEDIQPVLYEKGEEAGKRDVEDEVFEALMILSVNEKQVLEAKLYMNSIKETGLQQELRDPLQQLKISVATKNAGIDEAELQEMYTPVSIDTESLDESAKSSEMQNQTRGIVYIMIILMFMFVMLYGTMIATDVATEKSSRVMEILISSASPVTHLFAKIAGMTMVGLSQLMLFVVVGYALIFSKKDALPGEFFDIFGMENVSVSLLIYAVLFFLLGYLLYATLAAVLGSLVSRAEDVNQIILPMTFLLLIGFYIAIFGIELPASSFVTVTSYIPFFTPMVMFLRIGMLNIPIWEIILSFGILIASIVILAVIGARIYKGGVLIYGKSSSFKDIKKAMDLSKSE